MRVARRPLWRLSTASLGALLLVLCSGGQAQAAASGVCTSNAPDPGSTMTITINSAMAPASTTIAVAGDVVTINMAPQAACAGLNAIVVNGDGAANPVTFTGSEAFTVTGDLGAGDDEFTTVGSQPVDIDGGADADALRGGDGNDTLSGGDGDDLLQGGPGTDTLNGDGGADTASYAERATDVAVSVTGGGEDGLASIENLIGGAGDDTLAGDAGANDLDGGGGDDLLLPGSGGGANTGGTHGTAGGAHGAAGDTVSYAGATADLVVDVAGAPGSATGAGLSQTLTTIENLVGGDGDDTLTGDAGANVLDGGAGDDLLVPGLGGGTNTGGTHGTAGGAHGANGDIVSYAGVTDDLVADVAATATATGLSQTLGTVENLVGGAGDDTLRGDAGDNVLDGGAGDDLLVPGLGGGTNTGGAHGDDGDTVSYADLMDDLVADVDGTATGTGVAQILATVENLVGGAGDDMLTGDAGDNDLAGGAGDDVLRPGLGGGTNTGGAHGDDGDTVSYAGVTDDLVADVSAAATATGLSQTLATVENLTGGDGDDTLTGDANDNDLAGGAGDDLLRPGLGAGANTGGAHGTAGGAHGDDGDTVSYAGATAAVAADLSGSATGTGLSQTLASVENLTGGDGDDTLTGDTNDNDLAGGAGDDLLVPGLGGGTNTGGAHGTTGDTVSYAGLTADLALHVAGTATGTGVAQTLGTVENLTGGAGDDTLTGDDGANALDGGAGDDLLVPGRGGGSNTGGAHGAGGDTISYADLPAPVAVEASLAAGTATVDGATQTLVTAEHLSGGAGADVLTGSGDANVLRGGAGADVLSGLGGDDLLMPGAGGGSADGGDDADTVSYADVTPLAAPALTVQASIADGTATVAGDAQALAGAEHLTASAGDDLLAGDDGDNILTGGGGEDTVSYADRTDGEDVIASLATQSGGQEATSESDTLAEIENLTGGAGDDTLTGDPTANELRGLAGDDVLSGGADDDVLLPGLGGGSSAGGTHGAAGDTVSFEDVAAVPVSASLAAGSATLLDPGADPDPVHALAEVENLTGGGGDDTLAGDHGDNVLAGGAGSDTVTYAGRTAAEPVTASLASGAAGQDGTPEADELDAIENLTGGDGGDTLTGDASANVLRGGAGADVLSGGGDDDLLLPGAGGGSANGNGGTDTISYADLAPLAAPVVTVQASLAAGAATVAGVAQTLADAEHLTGSAGDDVLAGDDDDNTLSGGAGEDTVSYADRTAAEEVVASIATLSGGQAGEDDTLASIENLTGGAGDDTLIGDTHDNDLDGGGGDDLLRPGGGNGASTGGTHGTAGGAHGAGGDTVSYEDVTGDVAADLLAGTAIGAAVVQTLAAVENLTGGGGDDTLTGDAADNDLDGGAGDDALRPGAGGGTNTGGTHGTAGGAHGADGDTVSFAGVAAGLLIDLVADSATGSGVAQALTTLENATGGDGDDTLIGDTDANRLDGGDGDDLLRPNTGGGVNTGGGHDAGDTLSYVDLGTTPVQADLGAGSATVAGQTQTLAAIENLAGAEGGDTLTGDGSANVIDGAGAGDTLAGGAGADVLGGGPGLDTVTYAANGAGQGITATLDGAANDGVAGEGDRVVGTENLVGGAGADRLVGNQAANSLQGGGGDDTIIGGGGNDTLGGGDGLDAVSYEDRPAGEGVVVSLAAGGGGPREADSLTGFERLIGGAGDDALTGGPGHDQLFGRDGADVLSGAGGDDGLAGMDGDDALFGGEGGDGLGGGAGNDRLDGGAGFDAYDAGAGDDAVNAFDGIGENVLCGDGSDLVQHDLTDGFGNGDCESRVLLGFVPPPFVLDPRPRDRDRDGAFDGTDCNDLDPVIRPGAPETPGNAIDENCDGADAPFPLITTEFRWSFAKTRRGTRVRVFEVRKLPSGARVEVTCTSRRSPRCVFKKRTRTIPTRRSKLSVRGYFGDRPLSPGSRIEVRVSAPRTIGRVISFTMRRDRRSPGPRRSCLPPGATTPVPCP